MVAFHRSSDEQVLSVVVNNVLFGYLHKARGFFTDPRAINDFISVSPEDLISIAIKADEVKRHGVNPPVCMACKGTPNYPKAVLNPNEGLGQCGHSVHATLLQLRARTLI